MSETGRIISVNISKVTGIKKDPISSGELVKEHGIRNDAHAGPYHRQISLLAQESINSMRAKGADVSPGSFGENLTTQGIDLPPASRRHDPHHQRGGIPRGDADRQGLPRPVRDL